MINKIERNGNTQKDKARPRFVLLREENESQHVPHSWRERRWQCPRFISIYSYITRRKCMRVRVQQEHKFLVTTERALWRYDNAFIFTNQSEVDTGITLVSYASGFTGNSRKFAFNLVPEKLTSYEIIKISEHLTHSRHVSTLNSTIFRRCTSSPFIL